MNKSNDIPRAFIYWNLHKHLFSCKNTRTGRVEVRTNLVVIKDAEFAVSQAGRARVLREKRKNVHAGVRGTCVFPEALGSLEGWTRVTYNPYKGDSFVRVSDGAPVDGAEEVRMIKEGGKPRVYAKGLRFRAA